MGEKMQDAVNYASGLAFQKLNIIPKDPQAGAMAEYTSESVYPDGYEILKPGVVRFRLFIPKAEHVTLRTYNDSFELQKEGGCFVGECTVGEGFIPVFVTADGIDMIYPGLPIGFGGNMPINFIEVMEGGGVIAPEECAHGTVCMEYLQSKVTGRLERICVYVPARYYEKEHITDSYPVLYLQHGHGENETAWVNQGKMNFILDNLIARGKAEPFVTVMCNGMPTYEENGKTVVGITEMFERFLVEEVMPYIEERYRVFTDKAHRAMAGLSMGSMQTSVITLRHQDLFEYAGIFSGFVQDWISGYQGHITAQYLSTYSQNLKYIFRGIGKEDVFLDKFYSDDKLLEAYGIECERKIYNGAHEWKVWQHCLYDFAQKVFWN